MLDIIQKVYFYFWRYGRPVGSTMLKYLMKDIWCSRTKSSIIIGFKSQRDVLALVESYCFVYLI